MTTPGFKLKRTRAPRRKGRKKTKTYSTYIYRLQKEGTSTASTPITVPRLVAGEMFDHIASEAARLSKYNKRGAITRREIDSAMRLMYRGRQQLPGHH